MIYTIYGRSDAEFAPHEVDRFDDLRAVSEGLAIMAVIAPPIWLIYHRLWWPLAFFLLYWAFCLTLLATPFKVLIPFIIGLPGIYLMLEGRELYRRKLESDGLSLLGLADASSEPEAIGRFLDGHQIPARFPKPKETARQSDSSPQLSDGAEQSAPVFGLFSAREP